MFNGTLGLVRIQHLHVALGNITTAHNRVPRFYFGAPKDIRPNYIHYIIYPQIMQGFSARFLHSSVYAFFLTITDAYDIL